MSIDRDQMPIGGDNPEVDPELARMIEAAELEGQVNPSETMENRAKRILEEAAPVAAMSIVQLSRQAVNERLRFQASAYILDRVLGDVRGATGLKPVWESVFETVTVPDDVSTLEG